MRMASGACLSTTRAISALDASPVPPCRLIRTTPDPGGGGEQSSNAAFTLFRREPANELLSGIPHSCRRWSDRYWRRQLYRSGCRFDRWGDGSGSRGDGLRVWGGPAAHVGPVLDT